MLPRFGGVGGQGAGGGLTHCQVGVMLQGPPTEQLEHTHDVPLSSQPAPATVQFVPCTGSVPATHSGAVAQTCPDVVQIPL